MDSKTALLLLLVPLIPFFGFLINGLGFKKIPKSAASIVGIAASTGSFLVTLYVYSLFTASNGSPFHFDYYKWMGIGDFEIQFSLWVDQLTLMMMLVITGVGTLIHIYSAGYMHDDEGFGKFFAFLNLFLFSMLILVMGGNYVMMFIGWEGVGLCSFLLIGFWNKNVSYNLAAKKAFIMNRIGDLGFLLGIFLIIDVFGTTDYGVVFSKAAGIEIGSPVITTIAILLFIGAMGKSAQIPLFTWLPDAMAGPTPVSALIHAATMVTAGIYMVLRSNIIYVLSPVALEFVAFIGVATAMLGATIGLMQNDIKKVLAYSTVSQLGYMFLALGVGAFTAGFFHVVTHAFFKALLFLGAGSVIHAMHHEQDIRKMGGLAKHIPITFFTFLIGTIAISGIPPFAGFFSKDEILLHTFQHNKFLYALALAGSMMTAFYMFRLLFLTFTGAFRGSEYQKSHLHESPASMTIPLIILAVLSVGGGLLNIPEALHGNQWLANFLSPIFILSLEKAPELGKITVDHSTEYMLMGLSVAAASISILTAWMIFGGSKTLPADEGTPMPAPLKLVYNKFYVDELYNAIIVKPLNAIGSAFNHFVESFVIDLIVSATGKGVVSLGKVFRYLQSGAIGYYVIIIVAAFLVILGVNVGFIK
jgi:NADH-quinone oxidoreductase subunit L